MSNVWLEICESGEGKMFKNMQISFENERIEGKEGNLSDVTREKSIVDDSKLRTFWVFIDQISKQKRFEGETCKT